MREIRTLRAMWRALETGLRQLLNGHEEGNLSQAKEEPTGHRASARPHHPPSLPCNLMARQVLGLDALLAMDMVTIAYRKRVKMLRMRGWYQTEQAQAFRMLAEFAYYRVLEAAMLALFLSMANYRIGRKRSGITWSNNATEVGAG